MYEYLSEFIPAIIAYVDTLMAGYVLRLFSQLAAHYQGAWDAALILLVIIVGFRYLLSDRPLLDDITSKVVLIGFGYYMFATEWATFSRFVYVVVTDGTNELIGAIMGGQKPFDMLSTALDLLFDVMDAIGETVGILDGMVAHAIMWFVWVEIVILTAAAVGLAIVSKVLTGLLLGLAPIVLLAGLWDVTRDIVFGWLRLIMQFVIMSALTSAVVFFVTTIILFIVRGGASDGPAVISADLHYGMISVYAALLAIAVATLKFVPGMASAIGDGITPHTSKLTR